MNYTEYQRWAQKRAPDAFWLGELDVFQVMKPLMVSPHDKKVTSDQVLGKWKERSKWNHEDKALKITTGVRDGLKSVWQSLQTKIAHIWVPSDVYPVYHEILPTSKAYELIHPRWLEKLLSNARDNDAILIPTPLHPIGRNLSQDEYSSLLTWLENNPKAWLLTDAAYDYHHRNFAHERCVTLRTMSKSWLCRRMFGTVEARRGLIDSLHATPPSSIQLKHCYSMLSTANIPQIQQNLFCEAWQNIQSKLHDLQIEFTPPSTGYLTAIPVRKLPEKNKLVSIPATVFGSKQPYQIISCLGEISL